MEVWMNSLRKHSCCSSPYRQFIGESNYAYQVHCSKSYVHGSSCCQTAINCTSSQPVKQPSTAPPLNTINTISMPPSIPPVAHHPLAKQSYLDEIVISGIIFLTLKSKVILLEKASGIQKRTQPELDPKRYRSGMVYIRN